MDTTCLAFSSLSGCSPCVGEIHRHKTSGKGQPLPNHSHRALMASVRLDHAATTLSLSNFKSHRVDGMLPARSSMAGRPIRCNNHTGPLSSGAATHAARGGPAAAGVGIDYPSNASISRVNQEGLNGLLDGGLDGLDDGVFTVTSTLPIKYTIQEVDDILDINCKALLRGVIPDSFPLQLADEPAPGAPIRRVVVMDENVERIYGDKLRMYFDHHNVEYSIVSLPTWEENKDIDLLLRVEEAIENFKINRRRDPVIAIGGGVCLDVVGLACNLYRRGTPVIKVPTTLMGVVDASIGIKTAVNWGVHKNKLGTYSPPLAVFIDRSFLKSLDERNLSNGAAEILKMAMIKDAHLFNLLHTNSIKLLRSEFQCSLGSTVIRRSIQGMLEELEPNLWEHTLVRVVDHGHSFSVKIEMEALASNTPLLHGEAVNIDMALIAELSAARGLITDETLQNCYDIMNAFHLPLWHDTVTLKLLMKALSDITLSRDGFMRLPLMKGVGSAVFVDDVTESEVIEAAQAVHSRHMARLLGHTTPGKEMFVVNNIQPFDGLSRRKAATENSAAAMR